MKKQYIKPVSRIVVLRLFGAVLDHATTFGAVSQETNELSRQHDDSFDWGAADDDEEPTAEPPKTTW